MESGYDQINYLQINWNSPFGYIDKYFLFWIALGPSNTNVLLTPVNFILLLLMTSQKFLHHITRILCLFTLSCSIYCSGRFDIHTSMLHETDKSSILLLQDPSKLAIFEQRIVPWLREIGHLSDEEITSINLGSLNRLKYPKQLPSLFHDSKKLFELVELLIDSDFVEIGSVVLKYMRSIVFNSSTFKTVLESLSLDNLTVFNQVIKIWYPKNIDVVSLIHNLVDLRMGEDDVMEIINLTWSKLVTKSSEEFIYNNFAKIMGSAMLKQYVSVFEDILERLPNLINYIHQGLNCNASIIHLFCQAADPESLNKLKTLDDERSSFSSSEENDGSVHSSTPYFDHLTRSYSDSNKDLLEIMMRFGADINSRDCDNLTPIHVAINFKNAYIVQVLIDGGADISARDGDGMTPLHRAIYFRNVKIVKILIDGGADINARENNNMTPLHRAVFHKNANIVRILLDAGADRFLTLNGRNLQYLIYTHYSHQVELVFFDFLTRICSGRSRSLSSSK